MNLCSDYELREDSKCDPHCKSSKLNNTEQVLTAQEKGVCEKGVEGMSEDPLDCKEVKRHENLPEWRKETDSICRTECAFFNIIILYFAFTYLIFFVCIELNSRITKLG